MATSPLQNIPLPRNYDPPPNAKLGTNGYTWFQLDFLFPYVISGRIDGLEYKAMVLIQARLAEQGKTQVPISPAHFVFALRKCWRTCSTVLHRLSKKGFVNMDRFEEGDGRSWTYGWKPGAFDRNRIQSLQLIPMQTKPHKPTDVTDAIQQPEETEIEECAIKLIETTPQSIVADSEPSYAEPVSPAIKTKFLSTIVKDQEVRTTVCEPEQLKEEDGNTLNNSRDGRFRPQRPALEGMKTGPARMRLSPSEVSR